MYLFTAQNIGDLDGDGTDDDGTPGTGNSDDDGVLDPGTGDDPGAGGGGPVNGAPTLTATPVLQSIAEDANVSTRTKVADIAIVDDGLGGLAVELTGENAALFEIIGDELYLKAGISLDFESDQALEVTITADDPTIGAAPDVSADLVVAVEDVDDEAPLIDPNQSFELPENSDPGTEVGTVQASDNLEVTAFSLEDGDPDTEYFAIDSNGRVMLTEEGAAAAANDFETLPNSFTVSVTASDDAGNVSDPRQVTINVGNGNDPAQIERNETLDVVEGGIVDLSAGLAGSDPDDEDSDLTYSIIAAPLNGMLKNGEDDLASGATFTQSELENGDITYHHSGGNDDADEFTFTFLDDEGAGTGSSDSPIGFSFTVIEPARLALSNEQQPDLGLADPFIFGQIFSGDVSVLNSIVSNNGDAPAEQIEFVGLDLPWEFSGGFPGDGGTLGSTLNPGQSSLMRVQLTAPTDGPSKDFTGDLVLRYFNGAETVTLEQAFEVSVFGGNFTPTRPDDLMLSGSEDDAAISGAVSGSVDPEGEAVVYNLVSGSVMRDGSAADDGLVTVNGDGDVIYVPTEDQDLDDATDTREIRFEVTASDGIKTSDSATVTITVRGADDEIEISGDTVMQVLEDSGVAAAGNLDYADPDADDPQDLWNTTVVAQGAYGTLTIEADGAWRYLLDDANPLVNMLDENGRLADQVTVESADGTDQVIMLDVQGANDAPEIISASTILFEEGTEVAATLEVTDPDDSQFQYSVSGGDDADNFTINGSGALSFLVPPVVDAPSDLDTDNIYQVEITVADTGFAPQSISKMIEVSVTEVQHYTLSLGTDDIAAGGGNNVIAGTSATLTSGDSLDGGDGTDTLRLLGDGAFRLDQIEAFQNIERVEMSAGHLNINEATGVDVIAEGNSTISASGNAELGDILFSGSGNQVIRFQANSIADRIEFSGNAHVEFRTDVNFDESMILLSNGTGTADRIYIPGGGLFDFTGLTHGGFEQLHLDSSNSEVLLDTGNLAQIDQLLGFGRFTIINDGWDLTGFTEIATYLTLASANEQGTHFTLNTAEQGLQVVGGTGQDIVEVLNDTFTENERELLFLNGSIEHIIDQSGTYDLI